MDHTGTVPFLTEIEATRVGGIPDSALALVTVPEVVAEPETDFVPSFLPQAVDGALEEDFSDKEPDVLVSIEDSENTLLGDSAEQISEKISKTERRCLVTGAILPKEQLVRFVLDPTDNVVPDILAELPGRGLWVKAERTVLETAIQKNLFNKAAKHKVKAAADLPDLVVSLLEKRVLALLGLAKRSAVVVTGQMQVEQAARYNHLTLLLVAQDAGQDGMKKLAPYGVELLRVFNRSLLGAALGHDHLVYLGLKPHPLTKKIKTELLRWQEMAPRAMRDVEKELERT